MQTSHNSTSRLQLIWATICAIALHSVNLFCSQGADLAKPNSIGSPSGAFSFLIPVLVADTKMPSETVAIFQTIRGRTNQILLHAGQELFAVEFAMLQDGGLEALIWSPGAVHVWHPYAVDESASKLSIELSDMRSRSGSMIMVGRRGSQYCTNYLAKFRIRSEAMYPLTFKITPDKQYQYMCGRGEVVLSDGKGVQLGRDDTAETWVRRLSSNIPSEQEAVVFALLWLRNDESKSALESFVKSANPRLKAIAAAAIKGNITLPK